MEYVPGETLENIIAAQGALDVNRALDFTCQICNAVDHAHRQGVIHRDLRPANVLVTENDMVKVADFGTSRFLEIAAHGTTVIGSPPYMAPEQFHGKAVFASDIYSLGVTMYQMLTGMLPYDTPAPADLDRLMSGELVSPPRLKNPAIPKAISDIVMRAMAPDVTARYQRAADLLEDVLAARDAGARPPAGRRLEGTAVANAGRCPGHPVAAAGARSARRPVLLAVPQAAARADRSLPVLWRDAVDSAGPRSARSRVRSCRAIATRVASRESRPASPMLNCIFRRRRPPPTSVRPLQGVADGLLRLRKNLDERLVRRLGRRQDSRRVARHPLRQRRLRGRALLRHAARLGLLPARRPHAPALRLRARSTGWSRSIDRRRR